MLNLIHECFAQFSDAVVSHETIFDGYEWDVYYIKTEEEVYEVRSLIDEHMHPDTLRGALEYRLGKVAEDMATKGQSHMARTLAYLKQQGVAFHKTEQWVSFFGKKDDPPDKRPGGVRRDLFNMIDVLAMYPQEDSTEMDLVGIQVMGPDVGTHRTKIYDNPLLKQWLATGSKMQFWSWIKRPKKVGSKALVWKLRIIHIRTSQKEDFEFVEEEDDQVIVNTLTRSTRKPKVDVADLKAQLAALRGNSEDN